MRRPRQTVFAALACLHAASAAACPVGGRVTFPSCYAVDGDTLRCGDERVRLKFIDTPERGQAGFREAKDRMRAMVAGVPVTCDLAPRREKYGRLLGTCSVPGVPDLGAVMLRETLAAPYRGRR